MNWLAHVFLSEQKIDFQIGNFIADPLKAKPWENASDDMKKGMLTHKIIDSYTDSHEIFKQSKKRLKDKGLLKAIIIDFTYDYLLTKNWDKFSTITLDKFTETFYSQAGIRMIDYPQRPNQIVNNMINRDLLNYQSFDHLELAFKRLDKRLSPKLASRDNAISYLDIVSSNINDLEKDFMVFFPELCQKVKQHVDARHLQHWKI